MKKEDKNMVSNFFNQISNTYKSKYKKKETFHYYFFNERLEKAVKDLNLNNTKILDIGAGTGDLYDFILERHLNLTYTGTDVAAGMLENSSIPSECRFLGDYSSLNLPFQNYDFGFMLGVSTYLSQEQMEKYIQFFYNNVQDTIIVSFTNKFCFDNLLRKILKPIILLIPNKKNVIAQNIKISTYSLKEASDFFNEKYNIEKVEWLNHTIFPFNLLFEKFSIYLANIVDRTSFVTFLSWFSSDFIIKAKRKN